MQANIEHLKGLLLIGVSGRLDTLSAPQFDAQVAPLLTEPQPRILVDMSGVTYISSAGLRSILQLVKHTDAHGGRVGLFSIPAPILEVIEISGFPSLLDLYADRASAVGAQPG